MKAAVWIKDDLRLEDNPAVWNAMQHADISKILFVRSREAAITHVRPTARRLEREEKQLRQIEAVLERTGTRIIRTGGEADEIVSALVEHEITNLFANIQIGDDLGYRRDNALIGLLGRNGIIYHETCADGITRGTRPLPPPFVTRSSDLKPLRFATVPEAILSLRYFLNRLPRLPYRAQMWKPGEGDKITSRLSIDIACGALSVDRVLHETALAMEKSPRKKADWHQFAARVHWRRSFVQSFERNVDAFPWRPLSEETPDKREALQKWLHGETGYPLVDAAMAQLHQEGWTNFRMRQMVCSFAVDLLDLDPYRVGVALGELFDDYCPGIHWMQIARQSGMMEGVGPRVVNPVKQAKDLDPKGDYVRQWLPYLPGEHQAHIFEPWKSDSYKGPSPIVHYTSAAKAARDRRDPIASKNGKRTKETKKQQLSLI
ncbi:MAG: FAD-binding domain-containing protein [Parvularcula sp.]|jgi:deoxyribodipyrimidine photolyase|nr:FAD-binding domain-containing protein [Parvularcula sp.]